MKRRPDWARRLTEFLDKSTTIQFDWERNNCLSMVCDAVEAMTDVDPLADYRGTYTDEKSALAIVEGAGGMVEFVTTLLGPPLENPSMAGNGDVWVVDLPGGPTVGIFAGGAVWCLEDVGLMIISRGLALNRRGTAWRI